MSMYCHLEAHEPLAQNERLHPFLCRILEKHRIRIETYREKIDHTIEGWAG